MVGRKELDAGEVVDLPAKRCDLDIGLEKGLGGKRSKGADDPGPNRLNLF
jgi:hypothetical protein